MSWSKDEGASAVEYGLILTAIAGVIVVVVVVLGGYTQGMFKNACDGIAAQESEPACATQ